MRVEEYKEKTTEQVEFFTKDGEYIGFRLGEDSWAIAADEGYPNPEVDDVWVAEIVDHFIDEDGNDTFVVDLG